MITVRYLKTIGACNESIDALSNYLKKEEIKSLNVEECFKLLYKENLNWANWLITKILKKVDVIKYAIYAADQVIEIFEKEYPNDDRPRKAIEAAKKILKKPI